MAEFRFRTVDRAGAVAETAIEAASEAEAIEAVKRRGLILLETGARRRFDLGALLSMEIGGGRRLSSSQRVDFTRELATMLDAGLDLERALRFAATTASGAAMRVVIDRLREQVRDGASLAAALSRESASFPRLYVALVRAGEEAGALAETLARLADLLERRRALQGEVIASLTYPALLLIASIGAIAFLLTNVLPEFVPIFAENGVKLPETTRILLAVGNVCSAYWPYALAVIVLGGIGLRMALARPGPRRSADRLLLRLPVLGGLLRDMLAARFARTLGTLLGNGVALIPALAIVRESIGNRAAEAAVGSAAEAARRGQGLAGDLARTRIFPERTVHLVRLGEETGKLAETSLRAAAIHEEKARLGIEKLVALLVPAITIAMGAMIGFIVASLMLAMLGLNALAH